jgi:hypothetical protein
MREANMIRRVIIAVLTVRILGRLFAAAVLGAIISAVWLFLPHMIICVCEPEASYLGSPLPILIVDGFHPPASEVWEQLFGGARVRRDGLAIDLVVWTAGVYCLLTLLRAWRTRAEHRRRRQAGRCAKCGYDLTGNVTGVCPECGRPK